MELFVVRANPNGCFASIRINQPKISFAAKSLKQFLNRGCVAIRNGAIGSNKKQHDDPSRRRLKWIDRFAVQVLCKSALHRLRNAERRAKSRTKEYNANNSKHRYLREVHGGGNSPNSSTNPNSTRFARSGALARNNLHNREHIRKSMSGYRANAGSNSSASIDRGPRCAQSQRKRPLYKNSSKKWKIARR